MSAVRKILVVGGGIAGMTLALGLALAGSAVEMIEIQPSPKIPGIGFALQGPTLRALGILGLLDEVVAHGFGTDCIKVFDADGRFVQAVPLPHVNGSGYPASCRIMRPVFHRILENAVSAAGVHTRFGLTASSIVQAADLVEVDFTDGRHGVFDLVIGADGINSTVGTQVFGPQARPTFVGQSVWRATVARPPEVDALHLFYGRENKVGLNPVSQQSMYVLLVRNTAEKLRVRRDELCDMMRAQLDGYRGAVAGVRGQINDPDRIVCRPIESFLMPSPWYQGRVLLIGDAAHAVTPQMASGAGMAIEDSVLLTGLLASPATVPEILAAFMKRRYDRCAFVAEQSLLLSRWEQDPTIGPADHAALMTRVYNALAEPA